MATDLFFGTRTLINKELLYKGSLGEKVVQGIGCPVCKVGVAGT